MNSKAENGAATASTLPPSLTAALLSDDHKETLADDSLRLLESRVQNSPGLKGVALRTGLGMLKSARPDLLPRAVRRLLPVFITALEPFYTEYRPAAVKSPQLVGDFSAFLLQRRDSVMKALLDASDELAAGSQNATVRGFYTRTRGTIAKEISGALPTLTRRIDEELQRATK